MLHRIFKQKDTSNQKDTSQKPGEQKNTKPKKLTTKANIGDWAEGLAKSYLMEQGLKFVEANYRCKPGEIDLIMKDNNTLVFVEVRSRNNTQYGTGSESVTMSKQQKIIRAAQHYLQSKNLTDRLACRFDVVSVTKTAGISEWIPNAFELA